MKTNLCKLLFCALVALCSVTKVAAQDVIILNDGTKINAKIIEMGENSIKYQPEGDRSNRVISISRTLVAKVKMEEGSGSDILAKDNMATNYYYNDHKNIIKVGFTSFLLNGVSLSYERSLTSLSACEITARYQGINFDEYASDFRNLSLSVAYRYSSISPSKRATRRAHILDDAYVKPELFLIYNWYDEKSRSTDRETYHTAFILNFGREWVINNRFSVDLYTGYGFSSSELSIVGGEMLSFRKRVLAGGIRVGYVFGTKPKTLKK